uniref:NADAR domain-containing protein n=1 Tax=Ditylenchus dipsaci TaxID=166011 RepID=A0A915DUR0_9BILA
MKTEVPRLAELSAQVEGLYKKVVGVSQGPVKSAEKDTSPHEKVQKKEFSVTEKKHREHKDGGYHTSRGIVKEEDSRKKRADPNENSGRKKVSNRKRSRDRSVTHHDDGTSKRDRPKKRKHASKKHLKRDRSNHDRRSEGSDAQKPQFSLKRLRHSSVPHHQPKTPVNFEENMVSSVRYGHACFRNDSASDSSLSNNDSPFPSSMQLADLRIISDCSFVCFASNRSFLSSRFMRTHLLVIDERKYASVEQFYMYYKAKVFGDMQAAKRVMLATAPGALKKLGFNIANFEHLKWKNVAIQVMVIGTLRKFQQNSDLRDQLVGTTDSILLKATCADNFWGGGITKEALIDADSGVWLGQNVLGKILMMVRGRLIKERRTCRNG